MTKEVADQSGQYDHCNLPRDGGIEWSGTNFPPDALHYTLRGPHSATSLSLSGRTDFSEIDESLLYVYRY